MPATQADRMANLAADTAAGAASIKPAFQCIRLAQRIPVRIKLEKIPV